MRIDPEGQSARRQGHLEQRPSQHAGGTCSRRPASCGCVEMGPLGGDELNLIQHGKNYGWPVVSDGDNYDKSPIPDHKTRPEFQAPVKTWTPVISPSGAMFYDGAHVSVEGRSAGGRVVVAGDHPADRSTAPR